MRDLTFLPSRYIAKQFRISAASTAKPQASSNFSQRRQNTLPMALRSVSRLSLQKSWNPITDIFFSSIKGLSSSAATPNFHKRMYSANSPDDVDDTSSGTTNHSIASTLIDIFTQKPFQSNNPKLHELALQLNTDVVETVLKGLKSWRVAEVFFKWTTIQSGITGYKHNCYTYNAMASLLSRFGKISELRYLTKDVLASRCSFTPGALGFYIRCLGNVELGEEANEFFDQMKKMGLCVPDNYSYNCLLETIAKADIGSTELMEVRLKEMRDSGWFFDKYTLTPMMMFYCKSGNLKAAQEVFDRMYERGWADAHVHSLLLLGLSKCGKVDEAFEMVKRMEEQGIELNEKTFFVLIHGFVKESRVDLALLLLDKMQRSGFAPDISLYDVLIGGICRSKQLEKALSLYGEMKEQGIRPDVGILKKILSSFPDDIRVIKLLDEIPEDTNQEIMITSYNSVLNGLVDCGLVVKAHRLLLLMIQSESNSCIETDDSFKFKKVVRPNASSFEIVVNGLLKNEDLELALFLFRKMPSISCTPTTLLYNNLIDQLCVSDRLDEGFELLKEMKETGLEPTQFTLNCIYGCLCRRKDVPGALDILKEMRACGHMPWIKHSTFLMKQLSTEGRVGEACEFLSNMVQEGFLPDMISYSAVLKGLIEHQEIDRALLLFKEICSQGYFPDMVAYNILIKGLCKGNKLSEVEDILSDIEKKGLVPSVVTYNLLLDGFSKNGLMDKAMLYLRKMSENNREPDVITYTTLVDGFCKAGKPDEALRFWDEMKNEGCTPSRISFMALIHGLCKCSRPNAALEYMREMERQQMKVDSSVYMALVSAFLSEQNTTVAFDILKEMLHKGNFPNPIDHSYEAARDAALKISEDARTSSGIKSLIGEGKIPEFDLHNIGGTNEV